MHSLFTLYERTITEPAHQDAVEALGRIIDQAGSGYQLQPSWDDLEKLGVAPQEIGLEPEDTDKHYGIGIIDVLGESPLPPDSEEALRAFADQQALDMLKHMHGDYSGGARTLNGEELYVEGLAAELFGGSVFEQALSGHPASIAFMIRLLKMCRPETAKQFQQAWNDESLRDQVRADIESQVGISLDDQQLYYCKGQDGRGNVYHANELDMMDTTPSWA